MKRGSGVPAATVRLVLERATDINEVPRCEACGDAIVGERGFGWSIHHRRGRTGHADDHRPENLLVVCGASNVDMCHGVIHSSRGASRKTGQMISRLGRIGSPPVDPAQIAVLIGRGSRWVYLTREGGYSTDLPAVRP